MALSAFKNPNLSTASLHWLAGIVEGEGTFDFNGGRAPRIVIGMTDLDVIERAHALMGATGKIFTVVADDRPSRRHRKKDLHHVACSGRLGAGWMMTLYPLLGSRRRARIREVLSAWRKVPAKSGYACFSGHRFEDQIPYKNGKYRSCKPCVKKANRERTEARRVERGFPPDFDMRRRGSWNGPL